MPCAVAFDGSDGQLDHWTWIFDVGTGVTARSSPPRVDAHPLTTGRWAHVGVSYGGGTAVLCVDAAEAGRNSRVTVGRGASAITAGPSTWADPGTPTRV
ncbi:hypothetical protein [Streptomyces griseorubiginosus]|uniref:hypothetical protein n=1 Tax=Streptomyces griseorubiginosus TaxID=67304 RepID=UPI001AD727BD|nr:hypothetical protein [Streptomyces griseorubiginosus]MBO4254000.1 hypothetical protein [Streptomyces griseorubiginosus]